MPIISFLFALTLNTSMDTNLTLNDCFLKAIQRSYILANQGETLKQAEEQYTQAWQNFMPVLSMSGSGYLSSSQVLPNNSSLDMKVSQPLFRGFKSIAILEQSKLLIKAQKESFCQMLCMTYPLIFLCCLFYKLSVLKNSAFQYKANLFITS